MMTNKQIADKCLGGQITKVELGRVHFTMDGHQDSIRVQTQQHHVGGYEGYYITFVSSEGMMCNAQNNYHQSATFLGFILD